MLFRTTIEDDYDMYPPWKEEDSHGPVSAWVHRTKRPGERLLHQSQGDQLYYDFAEAVRIARRARWDSPPYKTGTKREQAVRAVQADFEWLKAWCDNSWSYVGVIVTDIETDESESLWGIPSDNIAYIKEVEIELTTQLAERILNSDKDPRQLELSL